jgi:hypothetical protein
MDNPDIDDERTIGRRRFLSRSVGAASVILGLGALRQDDAEQQVQRRMALERVARFERERPTEDYVGRIALLTAPAEKQPPPEDLQGCAFEDWSPAGFDKYQVLVIEKASRVAEGIDFGARRPDLETGSVIAEKRGFVAAGSDRIPPGTPYIIGGEEDCPGRYVGVLLERVPGRFVGPIDGSE